MRIVIDASVLVKWYVAEPDLAEEAQFLTDERFDLHAPELIIPEIGNILWKKYRHGQLTKTQVLTIVGRSCMEEELTLHSHETLFESSVQLAMETGQTVYDWMYLALALALDVPFVTADQRFSNALKPTQYGGHITWLGDVRDLV